MKNIFKKIVSGLFLAALVFTSLFSLSAINTQASNSTVYSDEYASAYINEDGTSGTIYLNEDNTPETDWFLYEIDGVPLKNIIQFGNGGYVDEILQTENELEDTDSYLDWYDFYLRLHGQAPSGLLNGATITFYDEEGDSYTLSLYDSSARYHELFYSSNKPKIVKITWKGTGKLNNI